VAPGGTPFGLARTLSIGLVLVMILSGTSTAHAPPVAATGGSSMVQSSGAGATPGSFGSSTPVETTLSVSASSVNLSSQFWGTTVNNEVRVFRGETNAVNATPARVLVWPGAMAGEDYDPLTETHYNTYNGTPTPALTNESQFVAMCKAIDCTAIVQVPAEIDDARVAEAIVNYTEVNLSFTPAYWMIGNEPELWEHWKVPWKNWAYDYTNGPDPTQFGDEVLAYVDAIRAVDNSTPILGLPASGCTCGDYTFEQWISGVLDVTGAKIQAVAFHEYPAGWLGTGNGSLQDFYSTIQGAASIPTRVAGARQAVESSCPGCNVSVFISELGSALSWSSYGQYAIGFSGALSIASQITQAMDVNLTNIDLFATELATTNSWFGTTGEPRPDYALYTSILNHLGTESYQTNFTGLGHTIYGINTLDPSDHGRQDLLVVNDNISKSITFSPKFAGSTESSPVEAWSWNGSIHYTKSNGTGWVEPYTATPVPQGYSGGLPSNYTLPPQSMVLFEAYPAGGTYVRVQESGVPAPIAWYASVGREFYSTTADNLSLLLAPGAYPVASVAIPLPIGGKELVPVEQLAPSIASPANVAGRYTNLTIDFHPQWNVNVTASPGDGGTAGPDVGWWNASEPLNLTAAPVYGYAFVGWSGWGPGSYNGTNRSITIVPAGHVVEKARFVLGDEVILWESGLPLGTPWSVTIRGLTTNTNSSLLTVFEPGGTYGFAVTPVPGYRALPANGGFRVNNSSALVAVQFIRLTPPPPAFAVTFQVTGLPASTPVSVTVRGLTQTAGLTDLSLPQFQLLNGSYAYRVGYVPGYHADVTEKTFTVLGGPLVVDVPFVQTVYTATWEANGSRAGLNWSVILDGQPTWATSAWVSATIPNGSYSYAIALPANFSVTPRTGELYVAGSAVELPLRFSLMEFPIQFEALGPAVPGGWTVRLGNVTQGASASGPSFLAANGTYTFDVQPPVGYFAVPSHGNVTISGPSAPFVVQFHPSSEQPSAALVAALTSGALATTMWIALSIFIGFATFRGLRRRGGRTR
jgi:hypothetical protein